MGDRLTNAVNGAVFHASCHFVALAHVAVIGFELDNEEEYPTFFEIVRPLLVSLYLMQVVLELSVFRKAFFFACGHLLDLVLVCMAMYSVFITQDYGRVWRLTMLRGYCFYRLVLSAEFIAPLKDLWIVGVGFAHAWRGLVMFTLLLLLVVYSCACLVTFWVGLNPKGFDTEKYFGTTFRSCITLMQVTTLDGWASRIVRPLAGHNGFVAIFLIFYAVCTGYGLISVVVGLLVQSTVRLARSHHDHASTHSAKHDITVISNLVEFFKMMCLMEDRSYMRLKDLRDSMINDDVRSSFKLLDLPVKSTEELFNHIDRDNTGEITIEAFHNGLMALKKPASRFDLACLTAKIGGSVTYVARLEHRTDILAEDIRGLKKSIGEAISILHDFANADHREPEVVMRRAGIIKPGIPAKKSRYH